MKVGIIGTGAMGRTHAESWTALGVEIGGVVSRSLNSAETFATQYSSRAYTTLEAMLDAVDVIDICTPTHLHHPMTLAAARAGKHVICEKPLARTLAEADEMIAVCAKQGVKLMVAHVLRYFPAYADLQARVANGTIGELGEIKLARLSSGPVAAWFYDQAQAGGMILDLMIHDFDYARWIGGDVSQVHINTMGRSSAEGGIDFASVTLTHDGGIISTVDGSWANPAPYFRTMVELSGTTGSLTYDSHALTDGVVSEDPYTIQLRAFRDHIIDDEPLIVSAEDGRQALAIALAALDSAEKNTR